MFVFCHCSHSPNRLSLPPCFLSSLSVLCKRRSVCFSCRVLVYVLCLTYEVFTVTARLNQDYGDIYDPTPGAMRFACSRRIVLSSTPPAPTDQPATTAKPRGRVSRYVYHAVVIKIPSLQP